MGGEEVALVFQEFKMTLLMHDEIPLDDKQKQQGLVINQWISESCLEKRKLTTSKNLQT